ncbi:MULTISPECIES: YihY/virulence factor BrkB family protein [unclassified Clostridioides]|uniref:YihY/virulence factor BrkB family protein n=1 Tax=unclassified Clostridioides TaxID=2635829 RepID=UPI0006BBE3DE|nr:membrane protein [Clostridioides difficile]MCC0692929.1 YihY/virulence factor BrkB family protein [Clostridioides sp. ZZV14-6387]KPI52613.1 membrane protein [Clostridioides difficile]MCI9975787.1 YihY/virulence factor BrkB family protein [Clostridioides difficile]MDB3084574.1 YihY/virulence factor BrkB family protein [Clostridioides difficile]
MFGIDKKLIEYIVAKSNYSELSSKSAEVSFFLMLSIFPFLIFTISSIAYIPVLHLNKYIELFRNMMPESAFDVLSSIIVSAIDNRSLNFLAVSFGLTMWTFSRAVKALIKGMNRAYKVKETRSFFKILSISFLFTIMLLVLIFLSMIFLVYGEKIGYFIFNFIGLDKIFIRIWDILRYSVGILTIIVIFTALYKYTPNKKLTLKESAPGAIFATFSWFLVSFLYSYYTNYYANYEVIYGSIAEIIVLMTWMYFSSWSIVIGYEVNSRLYFRKIRNESLK